MHWAQFRNRGQPAGRIGTSQPAFSGLFGHYVRTLRLLYPCFEVASRLLWGYTKGVVFTDRLLGVSEALTVTLSPARHALFLFSAPRSLECLQIKMWDIVQVGIITKIRANVDKVAGSRFKMNWKSINCRCEYREGLTSATMGSGHFHRNHPCLRHSGF